MTLLSLNISLIYIGGADGSVNFNGLVNSCILFNSVNSCSLVGSCSLVNSCVGSRHDSVIFTGSGSDSITSSNILLPALNSSEEIS